jgi:hypothetical protein
MSIFAAKIQHFFNFMSTNTNLLSSKPHYEILDGLRGVTACIFV